MIEKIINEKTLIPLSLVITLIGGVAWLTNLAGIEKANANEIQSLKHSAEKDKEYLIEELRIINSKLDMIRDKMK